MAGSWRPKWRLQFACVTQIEPIIIALIKKAGMSRDSSNNSSGLLGIWSMLITSIVKAKANAASTKVSMRLMFSPRRIFPRSTRQAEMYSSDRRFISILLVRLWRVLAERLASVDIANRKNWRGINILGIHHTGYSTYSANQQMLLPGLEFSVLAQKARLK